MKKHHLIGTLTALLFTAPVTSQATSYTNAATAGSFVWATSANWNPNGTPGVDDTVTLSGLTGDLNLRLSTGTTTVSGFYYTTNNGQAFVSPLSNGTAILKAATFENSNSRTITFQNSGVKLLQLDFATVNLSGGITRLGTAGGSDVLNSATFGVLNLSGASVLEIGNVRALTSDPLNINLGDVTLDGTSEIRISATGAAGAFSNTVQVSSLSGTSGWVRTSSNATSSVQGTLVIDGAAATSFGGTLGDPGSAVRVLNLERSGSGTQTLTGSNSYTGSTTVKSGSLLVSGTGGIRTTSGIAVSGGVFGYTSSIALDRDIALNGGTFLHSSSQAYTGALTFTGGVLAGTNWNGNLGGLTIGAGKTIAPGDGPGTASTTSQTWDSLGSYNWEINDAAGAAGLGWDLLDLSGNLGLTATSTFKFTLNVTSLTLASSPGNTSHFDSSLNYLWLIADSGSAISGFDARAFGIDTSHFLNSFNGVWSIVKGDAVSGGDDTQLYLSYAAVPEPAVNALLFLGGLAFAFGKRRRAASV